MTSFSTLSEFLLQSGSNFLIFDLGRGIHRMSGQSLLAIETQGSAAPFPRQQHLWLGIVFWDPSRSEQHYVWFLKFPLDERGLLQTAARDHFLSLVLDALAQSQQADGENASLNIPDNPYGFAPPQQLMADFHAVTTHALGQKPSNFYKAVVSYLGSYQVSDWKNLGLQGIADVVARLTQDNNAERLSSGFAELPESVQQSLCASMEHQVLPDDVEQAVLVWTKNQPVASTNRLYGLRALSQCRCHDEIMAMINNALQQAPSLDLFTTIAARHWHRFGENDLLEAFFESLANSTLGQDAFNGLYQDLVQLPLLRQKLHNMLHQSELSERLTASLNTLRATL